ncbi:MAG TPA: DUF4389 domain-containing protein [Marmoricola sp.]|nr:DUF4389 domain-containing protein [Marmoricola sp.]
MATITAPKGGDYPVRVDAELDPGLSRWLWLVKWVLVIPHYVVLVFLWIAFMVTSIVAFFGILITGRYPRGVFEFNVGVLRWSWRVTYYAYGALATDRYPPFTLREVPDYPAHLEVDYPEHLSRGLVLVKWWLLAIPHYLVLGLFLGAGYAVWDNDGDRVGGPGLIALLVVIAGVVLLFTGRYPQQLYDLVLGLNRWVLRVAGYVALMTDTYPPFRLDQGGHESGERLVVADPPREAPAVTRTAPPSSGWSAGRVVALVIGTIVGLGSLALGIPAAALVAADLGGRDDAGFLMTPTRTLASPAYAVVSEDLELHSDAPDAFLPETLLGDTRVEATSTRRPVFVGIGPAAAVHRYLAGVETDTLEGYTGDDPELRTDPGGAPTAAPGDQGFWVTSSAGSGTRSVTWTPRQGDWVAVVMNADGSAGIRTEISVGAEVPALGAAAGVLLGLAGIGLVVAVVVIALAVHGASRAGASTELTPSR